MKKLGSHFWYSRTQRNGILFLGALIVLLQAVLCFYEFETSHDAVPMEVLALRKQLDSLHAISSTSKPVKIYPFNPNYISDYKGYRLGMSMAEIDRLHRFRQSGKYVNSEREFQQVTLVSDSLLSVMAPHFKFPEWVNRARQKKRNQTSYKPVVKNLNELSSSDLNRALASDFAALPNISESLAERIVSYRNKLKGYSFDDQLQEVWNMESHHVKEILKVFSIQTPPTIEKLNINTASFKQVLALPYINYDLCKKLFAYRDEVAELQSIAEIKNVEGFPKDKYNRIVLYLSAE